MTRSVFLVSVCLAAAAAGGCNGGGGGMSMLSDWMGKGTLDTPTIVSGLKQALEVGTNNAVSSTGRAGGYWSNLAIRIVMPEKLQKVASALRKIGLGGQVDAFERKMNDAAEAAASQAGTIFLAAIRDMTFADARGILAGGETAATDYFRGKTSASLRALYLPVVRTRMQELGVVTAYDSLLGKYMAIPLAAKPDMPRIEEYVTDKALEGLFKVVAEEERAIRRNPAARTTALLQKVFAAAP